MADKASLINEIVSIELGMFQQVPTVYPTKYQESPEGFKLMRAMSFETWSENTLQSYLNDLSAALKEGRNLMTEKYARMDNLIPTINANPIIDEIVKIESEWQKELYDKYPRTLGKGALSSGAPSAIIGFIHYLKSELETYSDKTLESYYKDLQQALEEGRNMSYEKYTSLFQRLGYGPIEDVERKSA